MTPALGVLLSGLLLAAAGDGGEAAAPSPWRHNPRGRTAAGIELQNDGDLAAAGEAFGTALELAPADPVVRFNAGTASLLGGGDQAVELLRTAAQLAPPELQPAAYYNLGNAQLAAESLPEAIESYKQSLRLEPGNVDVKHNLELAQRLLEQQQQQQEEKQDQSQQDQQDQRDEQQNQQQQQQQQQQEQEQPPDEQQQRDRQEQDSPLPDFEDQPDMTAEQAAAILEAVENLEREQRRKQAMEQLKRAKGDRDW